MKVVTYAIYKQDNIWGLESTDHSKMVRSQHSSRKNALNSLFIRYPHLTKFDIALSDTPEKDYITFRKISFNNKLWQAESREYVSRAKALSSFFARHSGITLFYVAIPVKVGGEPVQREAKL